jgi:hypothetical protein
MPSAFFIYKQIKTNSNGKKENSKSVLWFYAKLYKKKKFEVGKYEESGTPCI